MWRMKIKYICDPKSGIQLQFSYCDKNEAPTINLILSLSFCIFPDVQSRETLIILKKSK